MSPIKWRKSSHSGLDEGDCVEVAQVERVIVMRDSKHPEQDVLLVEPRTWSALLAGVSGRLRP